MKKGFTLIELLSVIVILGVIALITSPMITGIINNSKKGAFEDSVYGVIKAIELDKAESKFNVNRIYTISPGTVVNDTTGVSLETKGSVNGFGSARLDEDGNIQLVIQYEEWCATKEYERKEVVLRPAPCIANADKNVNNPWLLNNLIPVKWSGSSWVRADSRNPASDKWYKYDEKQWANAVLVKEANRDYYQSDASIGVIIPTLDILAHFVWIPRFNYAITATNEVTINFEEGVPNKATGTGLLTSYLTHPAFTFGEKELTGFWFGKFETTGTVNNITVLPNAIAIRNTPFVNFYNAITELPLSNNQYGFVKDRVDVRITKNNEWGAVAYLTNSSYGRCTSGTCTTVRRNNSSNYTTGCSGTATNSAVATCSNAYQTLNGQASSTTGNIYGVYDMAGGTYDFVMGNYLSTPSQSGLENLPTLKYYDRYTQTNVDIACGGFVCRGQALSETNAWYSGSAVFVDYLSPWLLRGNVSTTTTVSSVYSYNKHNGSAASNVGYRLTLSNK